MILETLSPYLIQNTHISTAEITELQYREIRSVYSHDDTNHQYAT